MALQLCLPDDATDGKGLFGVPNGDQSDDWTLPDGTVSPIPDDSLSRKFEPAFNYCKNWCVSKAESMFTYTTLDYESINIDCHGAYDPSLENELVNHGVPQDILDECGDDDIECQLDGLIGGVEDAKNFKEVQEELDILKVDPPPPPSINIEKTVLLAGQNTAPPNFCNPGKDIVQGMSGQDALYCYHITNTGGEPLSNIVVTDDCLLTFTFSRNSELLPGASFRVPFTHTMLEDMSETGCKGNVVATADSGGNVEDNDAAGHRLTEAEVDCMVETTNTVVGGQLTVTSEEKCTYCVCE
jgi:hypothetical protein